MQGYISRKVFRRRRSTVVFILFFILLVIQASFAATDTAPIEVSTEVLSGQIDAEFELASVALDGLKVRGRAAKTGYSRSEFGDGWALISSCSVRNLILQRDLQNIKLGSDGCVVLSGTVDDPYTGSRINFVRGTTTSDKVQIDHVVALSDSWQKGAQNISANDRVRFANDALNLLAVDGPANQQKGNSDAASWLPSSKAYRCRYVARQIAVKKKYKLWVTLAEKAAMHRVLNGCTNQPLPTEKSRL